MRYPRGRISIIMYGSPTYYHTSQFIPRSYCVLKFVKETFSIIVIRCKTVESHSGRQLYSSSFWPLDVLASMKLRYFSAYFSKSMCKYWGKGGGWRGGELTCTNWLHIGFCLYSRFTENYVIHVVLIWSHGDQSSWESLFYK